MKATGIVRRMDDLGRVVIPKEVRRSTGSNEAQVYDISVQEDSMLLKKNNTPNRRDLGRAMDDLGRFPIPRRIRTELELETGEAIEFYHDGNDILLIPRKEYREIKPVKVQEEVQVTPVPMKLRWTYVAIPAGRTFGDFVDYENFEEFEDMSEARAWILEHEKDGLFNIDLFDLSEEEEGNMECIMSIRAEKKDGNLIIR